MSRTTSLPCIPDLVRQLDVKIENYLARTKAAVPVRNPAYDPKAKGQVDSPKRPDKRPGPETIFQRRDANKDGFVTLQEYIGNPKNRNVPRADKTIQTERRQ